MINISKETAAEIVKQLYPSAENPLLDIELEASKGDNYRPYYVAAKLISTEYRRLLKADEVTFQYDLDSTLLSLLNRQKQLDINDKNIPNGQSVDDMITELCNICYRHYLGVSIF